MSNAALYVSTIVVLAVFALGIYAIREVEKKRGDEWRRAAASFGLAEVGGGFFATTAHALEGEIDGFEVSVKGYGGKSAQTIYEMKQPVLSLLLTSEGVTGALGKWLAGPDVQTGDPGFDGKAMLRGDEAEQRSVYDAATRAAAIRVLELGGTVGEGKIRIQASGLHDTAEKIEDRLAAMAALARRLAWIHHTPPSERLALIATSDPLPAVRKNALTSILARASRDPLPHSVVSGVVASALDDADPGIRFFAATCGRADLTAARAAILALVREPKTPDALRASAIRSLGRFEHVDDAEALLDALLEKAQGEARVAAIDALASRGAAPSRLIPHATRAHAATRAAVARALAGAIGDPAAQECLMALLADENDDVRLAAVTSLGAIANAGAVEKLLPLTQGIFGSTEIRRAATSAVAAIQSRIAGAGAGQLSVSDASPEAGALSASSIEGGALGEPGDNGDPPPNARPRKAPA